MRIARIQLAGSEPRSAIEHDGNLMSLPVDVDVNSIFAGRALGDPQATVRGADELAPVTPSKIVTIGLNYRDLARDAKLQVPDVPLIVAKFPSSVIGPGAPIVIPTELTNQVDWEVELGVVIGRRAHRVDVSEALDHVFGYTVANDVTARDLQFGEGQWVRAKSLDSFCPVGPVVVSADELGDPADLRLTTRLNGETMQDSSTSEMLFGVADLVGYCSQSFTLNPGDLILTGTPSGSGCRAIPPQYLAAGDIVECEIEGIGILRNPVEQV